MDWREACRELQHDKVLAFDIETDGLKHWENGVMVLSLHGAESGKTAVLHVKDDVPKEVMDIMLKADRLIAHNGIGFDVLFLARKRPEFFDAPLYDTMLAEQVLATTGRKDVRVNLAATMKRRIGKNFKQEIDHETWKKPYLSPDQLSYAANDVRHLHRVMREQEKLFVERGLEEACAFEHSVIPATTRMAAKGLHVDRGELARLREAARAAAAEAVVRMEAIGLNVNSPGMILKEMERRDANPPNTKAETLAILGNADTPAGELARDVLVVRRAIKRGESMYSGSWEDRHISFDNMLHPSYWQCGTVTTRFASSNPNMQQIPRDMHGFIGGTPGCSVINTDWSQLELRIGADQSGDTQLQYDLRQQDIHQQLAAIAWAISTASVTKEQRQLGKPITYTWTFAGGVPGVNLALAKEGLSMDPMEIRGVLDKLNFRYPGMHAMHEAARAMAKGRPTTTIRLPAGHKRVLVGGNVRAQVMVNTVIQGTAAVGLKYALLEALREGIAEQLSAVVHDSFLATGVPNEDAAEVGRLMQMCMVRGMAEVCDVPVPVDMEIADRWL